MLAFIGLFIVTCWSLLKNDVIGLFLPSWHGPMPLYDPFKILANVSAIALLVWHRCALDQQDQDRGIG